MLVEVLMLSPCTSMLELYAARPAPAPRSTGTGAEGCSAPPSQLDEQRVEVPILFGAENHMRNPSLDQWSPVPIRRGRDCDDGDTRGKFLDGGNQQESSQAVRSQVQDHEIRIERPHRTEQLHSGLADSQARGVIPEMTGDHVPHSGAIRTDNDVHRLRSLLQRHRTVEHIEDEARCIP